MDRARGLALPGIEVITPGSRWSQPNSKLYHIANCGVILGFEISHYLQFPLISIGVLKSQRPIRFYSVNFLDCLWRNQGSVFASDRQLDGNGRGINLHEATGLGPTGLSPAISDTLVSVDHHWLRPEAISIAPFCSPDPSISI